MPEVDTAFGGDHALKFGFSDQAGPRRAPQIGEARRDVTASLEKNCHPGRSGEPNLRRFQRLPRSRLGLTAVQDDSFIV
jgi:hypothetical protein